MRQALPLRRPSSCPLDGCTPDKLLMVPAGREEVNKHRDRLSLAQTEDRYIVYKNALGAKG